MRGSTRGFRADICQDDGIGLRRAEIQTHQEDLVLERRSARPARLQREIAVPVSEAGTQSGSRYLARLRIRIERGVYGDIGTGIAENQSAPRIPDFPLDEQPRRQVAIGEVVDEAALSSAEHEA